MGNEPKIGFRDLFWVVVILAVLALWLWDRTRLADRLEKVEKGLPSTAPAAQDSLGQAHGVYAAP